MKIEELEGLLNFPKSCLQIFILHVNHLILFSNSRLAAWRGSIDSAAFNC